MAGSTESVTLACPTCAGDLVVGADALFRCREEHRYTAVGLALSTNLAALNALWLAIRALEADAASLHFMATRYEDDLGSAEQRRAEADAAQEAAAMLRDHARRAQERLAALPVHPATVTATSADGRPGQRG